MCSSNGIHHSLEQHRAIGQIEKEQAPGYFEHYPMLREEFQHKGRLQRSLLRPLFFFFVETRRIARAEMHVLISEARVCLFACISESLHRVTRTWRISRRFFYRELKSQFITRGVASMESRTLGIFNRDHFSE